MLQKLNFIDKKSIEDFFYYEMEKLLNFARNVYEVRTRKISIAVSGGSDSMALLLLMRNFAKKSKIKIIAVTVDHKLREDSLDEAIFVGNFCNSIGVEHKILSWDHKDYDLGKIEILAREARYKLIEDFCTRRSINILLVGHTWNDQLETYEMRKSSGSGELGLACMSKIRSISNDLKLLRPLLDFSREQLQQFLKKKGVCWKNDPMNDNDAFKRIACRKKITGYNNEELLNKSLEINRLRKKRHLIEASAVGFLKDKEKCISSDFGYVIISLCFLLNEKKEIQSEILRRVIWNVGGKKYPMNITESILSDIINRKINTLGRCLIKIKKEKIYVFRELRNIDKIYVTKKGKYIFDNRFLVTIDDKLTGCSIECHREGSQVFKKSDCKEGTIPVGGRLDIKVPVDAHLTLPCLYQNNKMLAVSSYFINKAGLFDIFL